MLTRQTKGGVNSLAIVQRMPQRFTKAFSERLSQLCQIEVLEICNGNRVIPGRAVIASIRGSLP
ncbi:hypothetical protein FQ192_20345 [Pseudomonas sp. ANT_J12]|nr:hypothetical protein FQ192_20345 [Pseudomonas sp. ANT_J12]